MTKEKKRIIAVAAAVLALAAIIAATHFADFTPPKLQVVQAYQTSYDKEISVYDLVESVHDKSDVDLQVSGEGSVQEGGKCISFSAVGQFTVKVTATDAHGHESWESVTVTVTDSKAPELTAEPITVYVGEEPDYLSAVKAVDELDGDLSKQVKVDDSAVKLNQVGTYSVGYKVADRSGNAAEFTSRVEVKPTPAEKIKLSESEVTLKGNGYLQLEAKVTPKKWAGKVEWSSSDESVATVSDGLVYWQGKGKCTITAAADNQKAECKVTCKGVPPTSVTLNRHTMELDEGKSKTLTCGVLPSNWSGQVTWVTSNPAVATVSDGQVTWVGNGTCYISAYANDDIYDSCEVTCLGGFHFNDFLGDLFGEDDNGQNNQSDENNTAQQEENSPQTDPPPSIF